MVSECLQFNDFTLDYCELKIKVFCIYLQHCGNTQANEAKVHQFADIDCLHDFE